MSEIEIQKFERTNCLKITQLQLLQQKIEKEKRRLEQNSKGSIWVSNLMKAYGKQVTVATGVVSFVGGSLITQEALPILTLSGGSALIMQGIQYGISLRLKPELEKVKQVDDEIKKIKSEIDLRRQVETYLSYGFVLGSLGFYKSYIDEEWLKKDSKLHFLLNKIIQQLQLDEQLEFENPDEYDKMLKEREEALEKMLEENPEKIYSLVGKRSIS